MACLTSLSIVVITCRVGLKIILARFHDVKIPFNNSCICVTWSLLYYSPSKSNRLLLVTLIHTRPRIHQNSSTIFTFPAVQTDRQTAFIADRLFVCFVSWLFLLGCQYQFLSDWLQRLVYEMTYSLLTGTLNPTHSLSHWAVANSLANIEYQTCDTNLTACCCNGTVLNSVTWFRNG